MHIAIIGATGLVGSHLLKKLLANSRVEKVTTITRKSIDHDSKKLSQIVLEKMDTQTIENLEIDADVFFCGLGTTIKTAGSREAFSFVDHDLVVSFAVLAKKCQVKSLFIVSAMGANKKSKIFYNQVKGRMEEDIRALALESTYFLHPSLLIGDRAEKRLGESIGVSLYNLLSGVVPVGVRSMLGTKVSDIVNFVESEIFNLKSGEQNVSKFES